MMTECTNCGYEWDYTGELQQATCPSCQKKTPVEDAKTDS